MKGLLITYFFPPVNSIASHRTGSFSRYLNEGTSRLDVLAPRWIDNLDLPVGNAQIIYTGEKKPDPNYGERQPKGLARIRQFILHDVFKLKYFIGAAPSTFYREAMAKLQDIDLSSYDYILTSYGPLDCLHIGASIKKQYPQIKWIIDYRDLYSGLEYYDFGIFRMFFEKIEKNIVSQADGFVTVSAVLQAQIEKLTGLKGEVVYNGFEDYDFKDDVNFLDTLKTSELPVISYTGSLYNGERDVVPFLKYFKKHGLDKRFRLIFAVLNDSDTAYLNNASKEAGIQELEIIKGLSYQASMTLQNYSAFVLQFSNFNGAANGYLTGKVFEYIGAHKPIIYSGTVSEDYELYRLIRDNGFGESFDRIDYNAPDRYSVSGHSQFHRKVQAERLKMYIADRVGHD